MRFFLYIFLPVKAVFRRSGNVFFLTNPSFRLVQSEFLFSEKSIPLAGMKDFFETSFPIDGKKLSRPGVSKK